MSRFTMRRCYPDDPKRQQDYEFCCEGIAAGRCYFIHASNNRPGWRWTVYGVSSGGIEGWRRPSGSFARRSNPSIGLARPPVLQHDELRARRSVDELDQLVPRSALAQASGREGRLPRIAEAPPHAVVQNVVALVGPENGGFHRAMMPDSDLPKRPIQPIFPACPIGPVTASLPHPASSSLVCRPSPRAPGSAAASPRKASAHGIEATRTHSHLLVLSAGARPVIPILELVARLKTFPKAKTVVFLNSGSRLLLHVRRLLFRFVRHHALPT